MPESSVILHDAAARRWLRFERPVRVLAARTGDAVMDVVHGAERAATAEGLYAAGFVAYEAAPAFDGALTVRAPAGLPLAWFGLYRDPEPFAFPALPSAPAPDLSWEPSVTPTAYGDALRRIRAYIHAGDTYQVNYSYRLRAPFDVDPWSFFVRMIHAQGPGYGAFVTADGWTLCSASPELFFRLDGSALSSRPMKGTAARGRWAADDTAQAEWLRASAKNRAENVMIVDMVRNDMGRVAAAGTVTAPRLYDVERYPTVWQMTSTVRGTTTASVADILRALFPAASITGAPKRRTMEIIAELETAPRGIYTGTIGYIAPGRVAQFNVAIRTVAVNRARREAEYGVGGGIVWDSEEGTEWQECRTKARVLTQVTPDFALLETMRWTPDGGYWLLDRHLRRLAASAAYFGRTVDMDAVRAELDALAARLPPRPHRVRLLAPRAGPPAVEAGILTPLPRPYRVRLAAAPVRAANPFLYHKTTDRGLYDDARRAALGVDDVLLWNEKGEITESSMANVVVERDGRRLTPPLACGLLPGVYREHLLEGGEVSEAVIRCEDLPACSRLWLANSVRGLWEATLDRPA